MTTKELKAQCRAKAEEIARPHVNCVRTFTQFANQQCTCGRDAEVQRIAEALEAMYNDGYTAAWRLYAPGGPCVV